MAKMGRRILALLIDWGFANLVMLAFFHFTASAKTDTDWVSATNAESLVLLLTFGLEQWLMVATLGYTLGHRAVGIAVRRLDGKWVGFWKSLIRAGLLLLVIPATIWDADNRGLQDKAVGTVLVRL